LCFEGWGFLVSARFLGEGVAVVDVVGYLGRSMREEAEGGFFKSEDRLNSGDVYANKSSIQERSFETVKEIGLERGRCN
jgi:hypothetical protein